MNFSAFIMLISLLFKSSPAVTPTPVPTKVPELSPTPIVTVQPTATPTPVPPPTPTQTPQKTSSIMEKINSYRASFGLSPVTEDPQTCAYAQLRANELVNKFNHAGTDYPYAYSEVTENIAMTTNPQEVVDLWINSPTHAENMRKNTPYVCVRNNGPYYAYEGWRP